MNVYFLNHPCHLTIHTKGKKCSITQRKCTCGMKKPFRACKGGSKTMKLKKPVQACHKLTKRIWNFKQETLEVKRPKKTKKKKKITIAFICSFHTLIIPHLHNIGSLILSSLFVSFVSLVKNDFCFVRPYSSWLEARKEQKRKHI